MSHVSLEQRCVAGVIVPRVAQPESVLVEQKSTAVPLLGPWLCQRQRTVDGTPELELQSPSPSLAPCLTGRVATSKFLSLPRSWSPHLCSRNVGDAAAALLDQVQLALGSGRGSQARTQPCSGLWGVTEATCFRCHEKGVPRSLPFQRGFVPTPTATNPPKEDSDCSQGKESSRIPPTSGIP